MKTKLLSTTEYNGLPFDLQAIIKDQVNREETKWVDTVGSAMPIQERTAYLTELGKMYLKGRHKVVKLW